MRSYLILLILLTALCPQWAYAQSVAPARLASGARASDGCFHPEDFGTVTGVSDAAFQACAAAASKVGGTIIVSGNPILTQTVTTTNCNVTFASRDACIQFYPKRGSGIPLWILQGETARAMTVRGFNASGDGGTTLGVNNATGDCFVVQGGPVSFEDCSIGRFRAGYNIQNTGGHVYWSQCDFGANYYGIWFSVNNGDYKLQDCRIAALFSCIGYGDLGLTLDARRCAIGFAPFGLYQVSQSGNSSAGLYHTLFDQCAFEAIGNEAVFSEYARQVHTTKGYVTNCDVTMTGCAITFLPLYQLPAYKHDYAMEFDNLSGCDSFNFQTCAVPQGNLGTIYVNQPHTGASSISLSWRGASAASVSSPPGAKPPALTIQGGM